MHILAYIYAIVSLLAMSAVIVSEFRRKRVVTADRVIRLPPNELGEIDRKDQAARSRLQAACRPDGDFHLAHHSLGQRQLDRRPD